MRMIRIIGGVTLDMGTPEYTEENLSATWSITNFKWTGPALDLGFNDGRLKLVYFVCRGSVCT